MDKPKWKAGDTCQIKPSRKHGVSKARCDSLWTIYDIADGEALVHNGPTGALDVSGLPGVTCIAAVPLDCLLSPGEAYPTVAAEMGAKVLRLRARVAELEEAQRWRVTVREMPPVWVAVLGWWEVANWPFGVTKWDGSQWWAEEKEEDRSVRGPDRWMPLPGVPS